MFNGCENLKGGAGTVFDKGKIDKSYARVDGGTAAPGCFFYGLGAGALRGLEQIVSPVSCYD